MIQASYEIRGSVPYGLEIRSDFPRRRTLLDPTRLPERLSDTGLFVSLVDLAPAQGLVPYSVNVPLWSDGADKRRWIALPEGSTIGFSKTGEWSFPPGTLFVKHFELTNETAPHATRRLETRLLVVTGKDQGFGVTYRWRRDGSDADLLNDGASEEISNGTGRPPDKRIWSYPSREDCLRCHTGNAGFVLGPKTRQLNGDFRYPESGATDNQLRAWNALGMFQPRLAEAEISRMDRLKALDDASASLEERARSYLDANCMHCHRPGANIPASFDARFDTPLARQNMIGAATVSDGLGIERPRVVAPGDPAHSSLYRRIIDTDRFKMPPVARNAIDEKAASLVKRWIEDPRKRDETPPSR